MGRKASYTGEISLTAGTPVARPNREGSPDLTGWIEKLREVDQQTRQAGRSDLMVPFHVPAAAVKVAKLRFQQAATELGIGVSVIVKPLNAEVSQVLVSTMKRRERALKGAVKPVAATVGKPPVGLPKPAVKR